MKKSISITRILLAGCLAFSLLIAAGCSRGYGCYYGAVQLEEAESASDAAVAGYKTVRTEDATFDVIGE